MLQSSPIYSAQIDPYGVWIDLPVQQDENLFHASIFNLQGRRLTGQVIHAAQEKVKHHLDFDHAGWPEGHYMLVLKGKRVLRQMKLIK